MKIIAHRGASWVAPENTLAAFEAARRAGADLIEVDIQMLADASAAVIHNDTVDATTDGRGPVNTFTPATIGALDAGAWFSPHFAGQRVPLLPDLLNFAAAAPSPAILLEAKGVWEEEALGGVFTAIDDAGLAERFVFQSFELPTLGAAARLAPDIPRQWLLEHWREDAVEAAYEVDVTGVNPDGRILLEHPDFVDEMHGAGLEVSVWTLNEPHHWSAARDIGVDGIITDRPGMLAGWLAAQG